jgi:Tubulin like
MKLYQPVLFVGLGGTGCDIGAELERRMREEICGPDGNEFRKLRAKEGMLPYQLPSCVQFVYADMNQAELDRLPRRVVPGPEHIPATALTARYVTGLVPDVASYPELALRLRLQAEHVVEGWLPPATQEEPKVNPLHRGAGQFPTIGRAALFGTFIDGIAPAVRDIRAAIGLLAGSGEDLHALGGRPPRGVDVFVAFSVAGGTGSGIFYDYLHLIAYTLQQNSSLRVKIYPLVLMPSAFEEGLGGGRPAELNAGRALLDLFRLVDQQNGADAQRELRGSSDQGPVDPEEVAVSYPGNQRIVMRPGTLQTGFLFSQPAGATREDMHRSIVSLMMSLVGTEMSEEDNRSGEHHQSFADSFVNEATHRQVAAENGIGNRAVSTALVASLTVPVDELAGIVGARLLRTAVDQISTPNGRVESTRADMEEFVLKAGVHPVLRRHGSDFAEPAPATGARNVTAALNDRRESMRAGIDSLKVQLDREVPKLVSGFDPSHAARELLRKMDVFRVQRVVYGHPDLGDEVQQGGVGGMLHRRRGAPTSPPGHGATPPVTPQLRDRLIRRVQWNDEHVVAARNQQNQWYEWQTHVAWADFWDTHTQQWRRPLEQVQRQLSALTRALSEFARQDVEDFGRRSAELYRKRVGVSYLLPAGSGRMEQFYQQVVRRLLEQKARDGQINVNSTESDLLQALVGPDTWPEAFRISVDQTPEHAVSYLRERVKTEIKKFLREPPPGEQPMLPRLQDLLVNAAGHGGGSGPGMQQDYLDEFGGKLAGLLPANFTPQGSGPLKVLVNYPADAPSEVVKGFLKSSINMPAGPRITEDYRDTKTESISVVLFRTAMGVTEVDEVRDVLRRWAGALARPEPTDLLRWRQRTGYDFGYLATREDHRVAILHRLLCALWNGRATIRGPEASPERLNVELGGGVTMTLPLTPLGQASSWGSLLRAYELWALDDDDLHRRFCGQLMRELPAGLDGRPPLPSALYVVVRDLAEGQVELLDDVIKKQAEGQRSRYSQMCGFWGTTLPAALDQRFGGLESPVAPNLRELERVADAGASG